MKQLVTADGTYATQSALVTGGGVGGPGGGGGKDQRPALRRFLLDGEFFVAAALATSLTKLVLRYEQLLHGGRFSKLDRKLTRHHKNAFLGDKKRANSFSAEAMFILATIVHLGKSGLSKTPVTEDDLDRYSQFS